MTLEQIITPKLLENLDRLVLSVKNNSISPFMGARKSAQKGSSSDFSDYRAYSQADDIRKIDWKGYARSGKVNIRLYDEERQANISFVIDSSGSMDYGEAQENKFLYARLLSALLCYVYIKNGDCVNIFYADGDSLTPIFSGACSQASFGSVVKRLDDLDLSESVKAKYRLNGLKRNGICFVLSDFYTQNGFEYIIKHLSELSLSVFLIHLLSPQENKPDMMGNCLLSDNENNSKKALFIDENIISEYKNLLAAHKKEIKSCCIKNNAAYFDFSTDMNVLDGIFKILNWE